MDRTTALLSQLLMVAIGGLFGYSMVDLVLDDRLQYYLNASKFEGLVLAGASLLGIIVLLKVRGLLVAGIGHSHHHHHDHEHEDHDHDHEHGASLWRLMVLLVPLMILLTGIAPLGLSAAALERRSTREQREKLSAIEVDSLPEGRSAAGKVLRASTAQLEEDSMTSPARGIWESVDEPIRAKVVGQYLPDDRFTDRYRLVRLRITCCAADATPVGVAVLGAPDPTWSYGDWVEVIGPISFTASRDGSQHFAVLHKQTAVGVAPPATVYLQ